MADYPRGTVLCNQRWVQPKSELDIISEVAPVRCAREIDLFPLSLLSFWPSVETGIELNLCSPPALPVVSGKPPNVLLGVVGAEFKGITKEEELDATGARTVNVRSSDVRFEAWRVSTWDILKTGGKNGSIWEQAHGQNFIIISVEGRNKM